MTPADQIYSLPTNIGAAKLAYALANNLTVQISHMAIGDGNGASVNPTAAATGLVREVHRAQLNQFSPHPENPNWIVAELVIPAEVGGWTIREIGLYDVDGDLIFVGNHAEQYKPVQSQGSDETKTIRMVILVSSLASVTLRTDPTTVMATIKFVNDSIAAHAAAADPHSKYLLRSAVAADAGSLAWLGQAGGSANALTFALSSAESRLTAYKPGQRFHFIAVAANTGAVTAKIGTLPVIAVKKAGTSGLVDLASGDVKPGTVLELIYDGAVFQLAGGAGGSDLALFSVQWWPSRASIPAGYAPADGQALPRATFPDAWAGIQAGNVPTVADAAWLATPTERGKYTAGDGASTFRLPDYNGKAAGSLGAVFLRGDGALSAAVAGAIQRDAFQGHKHGFNYRIYGGQAGSAAMGNDIQSNPGSGAEFVDNPISDGVNGSPRTASETRPLNVTGCWIVKLFGAVTNPGSADAAQLATDFAALVARIDGLPFSKAWESTGLAITAGGRMTVSHDLGVMPRLVQGLFRCKTPINGYTAGQEIVVGTSNVDSNAANNNRGVTLAAGAESIVVQYGSHTPPVLFSAAGAYFVPTSADFDFVVRAWV